MKLFRCQVCDNIIYFENRTCGRCGHRLGYVAGARNHGRARARGRRSMDALAGDGGAAPVLRQRRLRRLQLADAAEAQDRLCPACRHNDTIPNISQPSHLVAWRDIELAKHRLFYSLLRWKLPLQTRAEDPSTDWRSNSWPIRPSLPARR